MKNIKCYNKQNSVYTAQIMSTRRVYMKSVTFNLTYISQTQYPAKTMALEFVNTLHNSGLKVFFKHQARFLQQFPQWTSLGWKYVQQKHLRLEQVQQDELPKRSRWGWGI